MTSTDKMAEFLVYILKKGDSDGYAWVVKKHIDYDVDKKKIKFDGDLGTNQFLAKYGDFSNDRFFICSGSSEYLETRIISECDFHVMKRLQVTKNSETGCYDYLEVV